MNKREAQRDWLKVFKQARELRELYKKGDEYASRELSDIQQRIFSSESTS